jgi:hypothetical protein
MYCTDVKIPGGGSAIICQGGQRPKPCACGKPTTKLCDWKLGVAPGAKRIRRCSVGICDEHTFSPAKDKDFCPQHAREWKAYLARKGKA